MTACIDMLDLPLALDAQAMVMLFVCGSGTAGLVNGARVWPRAADGNSARSGCTCGLVPGRGSAAQPAGRPAPRMWKRSVK